jgi:predicted dehydrogenase
MRMDTLRWGVVGPGKIARSFVEDLRVVGDAEVIAVCSRVLARARAFADEYGIQHAVDSYDQMLAIDELDAVYVATPHPEHLSSSLEAIKAGKAVLCEKPIAVNLRQARQIVDAARKAGVFLMEAMWTRFLPVMAVARKWIDTGLIGEPRMVQASFGFRGPDDPSHRTLNPQLAGGSLLDVGVYPIALAIWALGSPVVAIRGLAHRGDTGVDEQTGILLEHSGGRLAVLSSAVRTAMDTVAWIYGTEGRISLGPQFWCATEARRFIGADEVEHVSLPLRAHGFEYEAEEVARCIAAGLSESPGMPHADTLEIIRICDELRAQVQVRYPFE